MMNTIEYHNDNHDKPILRDHIYCSPRCGCGCKLEDYEKAKRESAALAKVLGAGWKPYVWENCGWHWDVRRGKHSVTHYESDGTYDAEVVAGDQQYIGVAKRPKTALRRAIADAEKQAELTLRATAKLKPLT